jgi:hypothetical protein
MKIAVFHDFSDIHYEMLGYLIDYFKSTKIQVDFFAEVSPTGKEWKTYYENLFKITINWNQTINFNPISFDLIFLVTDNDPGYEIIKKITNNNSDSEKVICIDHHYSIRKKEALYRVGTRFFQMRPGCPWALPSYRAISPSEKIHHINKSEKIKVCCIGIQNVPPNIDFLKELFNNFDLIEFYVIARKIETKENLISPNVIILENFSTTDMMILMNSIDYILCLENPNNLNPQKNCISGSIPLAFNFLTRLIIPNTWQKNYSFDSVLSYDDITLQKSKNQTKMTLEKLDEKMIYKINDELVFHIGHRNCTFDKAIKTKFPKLKQDILKNVESQNKSIFCRINNFFELYKYDCLVSLNGENIDLEAMNYFREIKIFTSENFSNYQNVNIHNDKLFDKIVSKIEETIIFNFCIVKPENLTETEYLDKIMEYIKTVSKRNYQDLIIFYGDNNIINNINNSLKLNKESSKYIIESKYLILLFHY